MEVIFYYNASDSRYSVKDITEVDRVSNASFKQPFNILDPVLQLSKNIDPLEYNYCYIPDVDRYYFIAAQPSYEAGFYNVSLHIDVLMSFRSEFIELGAIIARQEGQYNAYLKDDRLPVLADRKVTSVNFPAGFADSFQMILVVNGK